LKPDTDGKYAESYRIGYKQGYKKALQDAISVFKTLQVDQGIHIDDQEFYLALEDLTGEVL